MLCKSANENTCYTVEGDFWHDGCSEPIDPVREGNLVASRTKRGFSAGRWASAQPLRVLVVEDCLDVAEALGHQLREWGYDCRICTSGNEAQALAPYYQPNVVLIDIGLPDMSGWELAKRLPSDAMLIAVTARGEEDDFERSDRAGIRYHLVKPAYQRQLRELLQRLARDK